VAVSIGDSLLQDAQDRQPDLPLDGRWQGGPDLARLEAGDLGQQRRCWTGWLGQWERQLADDWKRRGQTR